ncbi:MAG: hypothetical protein J3R72DRAFT_493419 [Linnemannia gamsii]|nr:MAG: hypothetical protein J3R72DRAFT_493419 [Linnemannia gamsii]
MGGVEGGESNVGWMSLTRRQQQQQQKLEWEELGKGVKEKRMQGRVHLLDEDVLLFHEIVSLSPAGSATAESAAVAIDKDTTTTTTGDTKTIIKRADAPSSPTLPPSPKRVYEWTPPSAGSVYFCFLNHLDVAPYAPLINCGVYRTRNVFAFLLLILLMGEMVLSVLKGEMSIMETAAAAVAAGANTDEGSDSASSVSSTGATMGGNSAIRAIPPIPTGVNSAIPPIPAGVNSVIPPIPVGARSANAGMRGGMGTVAGLRGGASGGGGGITGARGSGIADRSGERGIAMKDIL